MTGFTEDEYNTLTQFVNFVAQRAEFRLTVNQSIELTKYLNRIQTQILPKMEAHILEVGKVTHAPAKKPGRTK